MPLMDLNAVRSPARDGTSCRPSAERQGLVRGTVLRKFGAAGAARRLATGERAGSPGTADGSGGTHLTTFLLLEGRCEEAMGFYSMTLGAEVLTVLRYRDVDRPEMKSALPAGCDDKILHAELRIGESLLMVSDGACSGKLSYQGFMLSLSFPTADVAAGILKALAVGGQINLPFGDESAAGDVGIVTDRFGVRWLVSAAG